MTVACRQARHTRAPLPPTPPPPPLPRSAARRWPVAVPASVGVAMQKRSRCRKVVVRPLPHAAAVFARPLAERDRRLDARDQRAAAQSFHARIDDGRRRLGQTCKITSRTGDRGVSNRITSGSASVTRRRVSGASDRLAHLFQAPAPTCESRRHRSSIALDSCQMAQVARHEWACAARAPRGDTRKRRGVTTVGCGEALA